MAKIFTAFLVNRRGASLFFSLVISALLIAGVKNLYFESDYKIFFANDNEQMLAHEYIKSTYTKSDNLMIIIAPPEGSIFTNQTLTLIRNMTRAAWETPYSIRVDSITNFQHSYAIGDELLVEDLVPDSSTTLSAEALKRIQSIATQEKQLVHRLISPSGHVTAINISLAVPESPNPDASSEEQAAQRSSKNQAFPQVVDFGNKLRDQILATHPDYTVHLMGVPVVNQSFQRASKRDVSTLIPMMYVIIVGLLGILLRSIGAVVAAITVIALATAATIGTQGWLGIALNQVNIMAPIIVLTIAVCDSVHLLDNYYKNLNATGESLTAMQQSLAINLQPIILTSVTTAVGFLSLNFAESPPFRELGTICAIGVILAMVFSLTVLPTITLLLVRTSSLNPKGPRVGFTGIGIANFVSRYHLRIIAVSILVIGALVSQAPQNRIHDDSVSYFKKGVPYRDAADFHGKELGGNESIFHSLSCGQPGCINNPAFLQKVDQFTQWYGAQADIRFVDSYVDVIKRLNKNLNQGFDAEYRIPEDRQLAAQYQLLYELSLPYGLDLNNQVNFDKSALRVMVTLTSQDSAYLLEVESKAAEWLKLNAPEIEATRGSSVPLMFRNIGYKNIHSMIDGSVLALIGVTLTLLLSLKSLKFGLLSLIPNAFPAAMAFGVWAMVVGDVNLSVAVVFSVTLGIVVDDTVHFLSKYLRGRRELGLNPEEAIRYTFDKVGSALIITTLILSAGFGLLMFSVFNVNAYLGAMTSLTLLIALVFDFLFFPALLLLVDKDKT